MFAEHKASFFLAHPSGRLSQRIRCGYLWAPGNHWATVGRTFITSSVKPSLIAPAGFVPISALQLLPGIVTVWGAHLFTSLLP